MIDVFELYSRLLLLCFSGLFDGRPADYAFLWLFNWLCCVLIGFFLDFKILMDPMVLSIMYVWCQLNKDTIVNFWFGTQFKVGALALFKGFLVRFDVSARVLLVQLVF